MLQKLIYVGTAYFAPPGRPAKLQAGLNDAIEFASTRGGEEAQMVQDGLNPGYICRV